MTVQKKIKLETDDVLLVLREINANPQMTQRTDDAIPCILEPEGNVRALRKSWARLIQKIYQVDPLVCPKCQGAMRIISFIEDRQVIRDILQHLGLWLVRSRPPPKIHDPPIREYANAFGGDMLRKPAGSATCPQNEPDMIYGDPEYSWDEYIYPEGHTQS